MFKLTLEQAKQVLINLSKKSPTYTSGSSSQVRLEGYNKINKPKIKSTLEYAEKFGFINDLYSITCKLYESDMNELIDNLKDVISNEKN